MTAKRSGAARRGAQRAGAASATRAARRLPPAARPSKTALGELARLAHEARRRAHAPFSDFPVGAALRARTGEIVTGCNIENASYGLTLCAERVAVFKAVSEGLYGFDAVAVVAGSKSPARPCGPCRQILWEFCGDIWVHMSDLRGRTRTVRLSKLFPEPFDESDL
jgi:cytidine deaminase